MSLVAEIPGQTTPKKSTTVKMPDLQNHIEAKPPFSASNYKKVTFRPPEDQQRNYAAKDLLGNTLKVNAKPTKASNSNSVEHILNKSGSATENSGSRQTHLIRSASNLKEESTRDMFDSSGQSAPPANTIRLVAWLLRLVSSVIIVIV